MNKKTKFTHSALPASGAEIRKSLNISITLYNQVVKEIKNKALKRGGKK